MLVVFAVANVVAASLVVVRRRRRRVWVSPYAEVRAALQTVTRTESAVFQPAGFVAVEPVVGAHQDADVIDIATARRARRSDPAAAHPSASAR